ncbi:hypothetical protein HY490_04155 [Candidatus Woesearchaeota archaeon]|nr:hypothetical protein [Candidatus Woesearchaeota archaeon]
MPAAATLTTTVTKSLDKISELMLRTKAVIRIIDNANIPYEKKMRLCQEFLKEVITVDFYMIPVLKAGYYAVFVTLTQDIIRKCQKFLADTNPNILTARELCLLILSISDYLFDVLKQSWFVGRKLSWHEKFKIRGILRKTFHDVGIRTRPVTVILSGSLARGFSDYKWVQNIPKPSDYDLPKDYREVIDREITLQLDQKKVMSDIDIVITSEDVYNSIKPPTPTTEIGSYRLGEKYPEGLGGSKILETIWQRLSGSVVGGVRGRWVNFAIFKDDPMYAKFLANRKVLLEKLERKVGRNIGMIDVVLLDHEIIR